MARRYHALHMRYVFDKYRLLCDAGRGDPASGSMP
jgi:hypothetical protein